MNTPSFNKFAGLLAILAGIVGFLYSLSFVVIAPGSPDLGATLSALFLLFGGLLSSAALIALYKRLEATEAGFALWALILGVVGALGSAIHGGYDFANTIKPPTSDFLDFNGFPNQADPRGLLTFGIAGVGVLIFAWLITRGTTTLPKNLGYLGYLLGILLIVIYLGRISILEPHDLVLLIPAVVTGFVISPLWYIWLGLSMRRE